MHKTSQHLALMAALAASLLAADFEPTWQDRDLGQPPTSGGHAQPPHVGGHELVDGQLTVTGAGQAHFTYAVHPGGDLDIVARIADLSAPHARAGIMLRSTTGSAQPAVVQLSLALQEPKSGLNHLSWQAQDPSAVNPGRGGIVTRREPPIWLRLVRIGENFAVYKSADGRFWAMLGNTSGWQFTPQGPLELGFFVAGGDPEQTATATFDHITIGEPSLGYRCSWVGNTFGCREADQHVSNGLSAMWVAADGTCYTSSYWDEAGRPVTSYRDGKVARRLPIGTPQTAEGGITGDQAHLYVATVDRITVLDPAAADFAPKALPLSVSLHDKQAGRCVVSGLAADGRRLFVADSREDLIRVVALDPVPTYHVATAANDGIAFAPSPVVPGNDVRLAPALVYQTQRIGEGCRYTLPSLVPGSAYVVRAHFAEYVDRPADCDPRNRLRNIGAVAVNVAALAGGVMQAAIRDFPGYTADAEGKVIVETGSYGGPGLCALEIVEPNGKRVLSVNCGGPQVADFHGESAEQVARNFPFERPGPMVIDRRGVLWIIQRGNDFPIGSAVTAKYPAAIKGYQPDGTFTGRQITDIVNPRALGYDPVNDQLLVAENGPDLNVRFYDQLAGTPSFVKSFGEPGGVYSGEHPGLIHDAEAGGYARFAGIAGVGVDAQGKLYVGGGFQGTDLRMFTADGAFGWMLNSLMFCNTYDVDPDSDGTAIYGTYNHLALDLAATEPGREQRYVSYNWDLRNYGEPVRAGSSQAILRRLGADRQLVMYTSGQGTVGDINIFRYVGEIAVPCGAIRDRGSAVWIDADGDGKSTPDEVTTMSPAISWITGLCIDAKGDIWAAQTTTGGSFMRHFFLQGLNRHGVPVYSAVAGDGYEDVRFPDEGDKTSAWAMSCRLDYDADRDLMVAFFPAVARTGEGDRSPTQYFLGCYDSWRQGNRDAKWKIRVFTPQTDPDYFMYEVDVFPYSGYMGMQIAGDYVFIAYLFGEVHVFDLDTGKLVRTLVHGPEVKGSSAWEDAAMGLRVFKRRNGEYLIFTENSGWGGKNNFFRWQP